MTHQYPEFPCIAKYPVDMWEEAGEPCVTTKSWAKLCMKVAEKNLSNLQGVFDAATKLCDEKQSEPEEDSEQSVADVFVNRQDLGPKKPKKGPVKWDIVVPMTTISEDIEV
eukprot:9749554-Lingulodinium_polyedra.AAC.1